MKHFILFTCMLVSTILFAQPRVDGKRQYQILSSSPIVTNIVGWAYNTTEDKWAGYYNVIWPIYKGNNKVPKRTSAHNLSWNENIVSLQAKKIKYKDEIYYALIKIYWDGVYMYPAIGEGWTEFQKRSVSIYSATEFEKFFNLTDSISCIKSCAGYNEHISEVTLANQLNRIFKNDKLDYYGWNNDLKFYIKLEDVKTIRFRIDNENLTQEYFEISKKLFDTLKLK